MEAKIAVIRVGGKQYLVRKNDEIIVDQQPGKPKEKIDLETLAIFTQDGNLFELGKPKLANSVKAEIVEHGKGEKIRVAKFKAKVRYRRVRGFRAKLTKIKIISI